MRFLAGFLVLILGVMPSFAGGPDRVQIMLGSKHFNQTAPNIIGEFVEFNPGVILVWEDAIGHMNASAGALQNSYGEIAHVIAGSFDHEFDSGVTAGVFFGAAYYGDKAKYVSPKYQDTGLVPYAGGQLNYRNFFIQTAPILKESGSMTMLLAYGLSFNLD